MMKNSINKYWCNLIIREELSKCEPLLDLNGFDIKILEICCNDFLNYIHYLSRNLQKIDSDKPEQKVIFQIVSDGISLEIEGMTTSDHVEHIAECVKVFVKAWWAKYKQRVKICFEEPKKTNLVFKGKGMAEACFSQTEIHNMIEMIMDTFFQYGEYCLSNILASNLLYSTLGNSTNAKWNEEDKINFITQLKREAKQVAYIHGTLLFIMPDLKSSRLREWRDSNQVV